MRSFENYWKSAVVGRCGHGHTKYVRRSTCFIAPITTPRHKSLAILFEAPKLFRLHQNDDSCPKLSHPKFLSRPLLHVEFRNGVFYTDHCRMTGTNTLPSQQHQRARHSRDFQCHICHDCVAVHDWCAISMVHTTTCQALRSILRRHWNASCSSTFTQFEVHSGICRVRPIIHKPYFHHDIRALFLHESITRAQKISAFLSSVGGLIVTSSGTPDCQHLEHLNHISSTRRVRKSVGTTIVLLRHVIDRLIWSSRYHFDFTFCQLLLAMTNLINLNCFVSVWILFYSSCFIDFACGLQEIMVVSCWHRLSFNTYSGQYPGAPWSILRPLLCNIRGFKKGWIRHVKEIEKRSTNSIKIFFGLESIDLHSYF